MQNPSARARHSEAAAARRAQDFVCCLIGSAPVLSRGAEGRGLAQDVRQHAFSGLEQPIDEYRAPRAAQIRRGPLLGDTLIAGAPEIFALPPQTANVKPPTANRQPLTPNSSPPASANARRNILRRLEPRETPARDRLVPFVYKRHSDGGARQPVPNQP